MTVDAGDVVMSSASRAGLCLAPATLKYGGGGGCGTLLKITLIFVFIDRQSSVELRALNAQGVAWKKEYGCRKRKVIF